MANYATLKSAIQDVIKTNGNNEITGALLQQSLVAMINSLGAQYQFVGVAELSTNPGTPDQNVFYIAGPGTYQNFNNQTIEPGRLGVFKYNGTWSFESVSVGKDYDGEMAVFNVNAYRGELTTQYTSVQARGYVPTSIQKNGLIITYYTNDGWIIEQLRRTTNTYSTNDTQWFRLENTVLDVILHTGKFEFVKNGSNLSLKIPQNTKFIICGRVVYNIDSDTTITITTTTPQMVVVMDRFTKVISWKVYNQITINDYIVCLYNRNLGICSLPTNYYTVDGANPISELNQIPIIQNVLVEYNKEIELLRMPAISGYSLQRSDMMRQTLNDNGQYHNESVGNYISSKFLRVNPGQTINFAYVAKTVSGNTATYRVKIFYYGIEDNSSYIGRYSSAFNPVAQITIPANVYFIRLLVRLSYNNDATVVSAGENYENGDISLSFDAVRFDYSITNIVNDIYKKSILPAIEIKQSDFRRGRYTTAGAYVADNARICIKYPLILNESKYFIMKTNPRSDGKVWCFNVIFLDSSKAVISYYSTLSTTYIYPKPDNAVYALITAALSETDGMTYLTTGYVTNLLPSCVGDGEIFCSCSQRGIYDDTTDILQQNDIIESTLRLQQVSQAAKNILTNTLQTKPLVFCHFSDIHGDGGNLARLMRYCDFWGEYIDQIIHTGDAMAAYFSDDFTFWTQQAGIENVLNVIGNHDVINAGTNPTQLEVYNRFIAPYVTSWGITQPNNAAADGLCYYYKDYATQKIRLIVLDIMHVTTEQTQWFENVLTQSITDNYSVIAVCHYPAKLIDNKGSFLSPAFIKWQDDFAVVNNTWLNDIDSFISSGGKFICWMGGHTHLDGCGIIQGHPNQIGLYVDTSKSGTSAPADRACVYGNRSQDCFNIVGIDVYSKTIKIFRVGANYDIYMRHIGGCCFSYDTHELILNW